MVKRSLPRSLDDLRGLRAARWVRESTAGQYDRYGPDSQHENMAAFVERYGMTDTGLVFTVAHSGRTVWQTDTMRDMVTEARAGSFDVLLVGYFDRWQRNLRRTLELVEDELHPNGVAWVMCDRRLVSSDPRDWDQMISEAHEAERYSRRLAQRVADGYASKFRRLSDQAGNPPRGFRRVGDAHVLEVDPDTIGDVVRLFERYASGIVSQADLADEAGVPETALREWLANPLYNGWASYHGEHMPAPWRDHPPVDDDLWERVATLRERRSVAPGRRTPSDRVDMLRGLLYCPCGARIRSNGTVKGSMRKSHAGRCDAWGRQQAYDSGTWERGIIAQVRRVRHDARTIERITAVLAEPDERPDTTAKARIERQLRALALDVAAGRIDDVTYLKRAAVLRRQAEQATPPTPSFDADHVASYLTSLSGLPASLLPGQRAELVAGIYDRITVQGPEFVEAHLTPAAYAHGLALALPEHVRSDLAGAEGFEPSIP